ncbi:hypothetical protein [Sinanaerobacter sp. ZZT-01]|uniref:hypothetical protein n=1 Tax=Sinanaerobacter sp. ZZT-01 TaxID=3111540 RepID=UPI002D782F98|nr:hypothetical protein [Sinanaerobacter sp. ZZT-01]WRR92719.1 hypothetical protein U5921_11780 [Sinanaerobacter sp. ZZT-01]
MFTFSLNTINSADKVKQVVKLIQDLNQYNSESLTDAYLNIMVGDRKDSDSDITLEGFHNAKVRNQEADKAKSKEITLEDNGESDYITDTNLVDSYDFEKEIMLKVDLSYFVETFLDIREHVFFEHGFDLWRLFVLSCKGDKAAQSKLRILIDNLNLKDFFWNFCSSLSYKKAVEEILGS